MPCRGGTPSWQGILFPASFSYAMTQCNYRTIFSGETIPPPTTSCTPLITGHSPRVRRRRTDSVPLCLVGAVAHCFLHRFRYAMTRCGYRTIFSGETIPLPTASRTPSNSGTTPERNGPLDARGAIDVGLKVLDAALHERRLAENPASAQRVRVRVTLGGARLVGAGGRCYSGVVAPVAQRIEHRPPEPVAGVRVAPGALHNPFGA